MANIRLKELIEANVDPKLVARSKESGKLVYFKTPQAKADALKAGSHEDPKAKKGGQPKADATPNSMFGTDYKKDRGAEAPKDDSNWMDDLDSIDVSDIKGKADPNADSFTSGDLYGATFKDPQTGKTITVGDAYEREDDSPAYQKAFAYVSKFDPDKEAVMGTQAYDDLNKKVNHPTEALPKEIYAKMDSGGDDEKDFDYLSNEDDTIRYGITSQNGKYYVGITDVENGTVKTIGKTKDAGEAAQIFMKNLDKIKSKLKLDLGESSSSKLTSMFKK